MNATPNAAHLPYLERVVHAATRNVAAGGGPFAALVVVDAEPVSLGVNQVTKTYDPTAHAEIVAIRRACADRSTFALPGAVLYSSCEPCPMCLTAAMWARIGAVYYAADSQDAERAGFDDLALYRLLRSPRDTWSVPVARVPTADAAAPFDAWQAYDERLPY